MTYFYDHHDQLVKAMHETAIAADREAEAQPIWRAELLRRRAVRET